MSAKTLTHSRHCCILLLSSHISKKNQCPLHLVLLDEALIATSVMPRKNPTGSMYWMFFSLFCNYDVSSHTHVYISTFSFHFSLLHICSTFFLPHLCAPQREAQSTPGGFCGFQQAWTGFWLIFSPSRDLHKLNGIWISERTVFGWKVNTCFILNFSKQDF